MSDQAPYAVIDIDGVLADTRERAHYLQRRPKDWDSFFAAADADALLPEGFAVANELAQAHQLVYLSGRPERIRHITTAWFSAHNLPAGQLILRPNYDRRPARLFKLAELRRLAEQGPVAVLVDDDVAVIAAARAAGFTVLDADWAREPALQATLFEAQEHDGRT